MGMTVPTTVPEAISVQLAAQLLMVHELTIRRWIKSGVLSASRVGPKLIRIPRSEIGRLRTARLL
jgi:excisionase family DNA binding protein